MLCTWFSVNSSAQNYAQQLQRISTDEGLSQGHVTSTLQDKLGFIWIGTLQGLNRFDGYEVKTFTGEYSLDQLSIIVLFETHNGDIFVSTEYSGAFIIDPVTLKVSKIYSGKLNAEEKRFSPIFAIAEHQQLFYYAINEHVYAFNPQKNTFTHEFSINKDENFVRAITIHNDFLYIATTDGLYSKSLIDEHITKIPLVAKDKLNSDNNNIKFLSIDSQLGLLVGTVEGFYSIAFNNNELLNLNNVKTLLAERNIWDYVNTPYGEFIVTEDGLYQYHRHIDHNEFLLRFDQSKFHMTDNTILDVMVDKTGLMWLASRSQGVFTWSTLARRFSSIQITSNDKLHSNVILTVYQDDNTVWLGTDNGLAKIRQDETTEKTYLVSDDTKAFYGQFAVYGITSAHLNEPGRYLWLLLYDGLALFDKKTEQKIALPMQGNTQAILDRGPTYGYHQITADTFAFFNENDYFLYDGSSGQTKVIKGLKEQLAPVNVHAFLKPLSNKPDDYVISVSGALYRYNEARQKLTLIYEVNNYNPINYVTIDDWVIDYNNTLWLASSQEGLIGLDATSYEIKHRINLSNGIKTKAVVALQIDQFGFLWFSSKNGIYRLDLSSMQLNAYTVKDGLTVNEFNIDSHTQLNDGRLAFGSTRGVLTLAPQNFLSVPNDHHSTITEITDISLLSRALNYHPLQYANQCLQLTNEDVGLEVSFSNFDFQNIDQTRYKVSLTGPNTLSYNKLNNNKVFFTKLPAGNYQLTIAAYNLNDSGLGDEKTLNFTVAYAPWRSPLAISAYALIFFAVLFFIFWQYRTKQQTIAQAHNKVLYSQQQTELALSSSNSGVWEINLTTDAGTRHRIIKELGYLKVSREIDFAEYSKLIHPEDLGNLMQEWARFISQNNDQQWQSTYRIKHAAGHWLWYQDIGKITQRNEQGEPTKVSGIYTNITEQRANAQQATVLGEAFSQINDWLLILDSQLLPFSVNNSFAEAFSINTNTIKLGLKHFLTAMGKKQYREFLNILKSLSPKQNWRGDAYIKTKINPSHPIHISITAVAKDSNVVSYYVVVISDLTEQKRAENELRYLANYDPLTKLPNRSLMYQKISHAIKDADTHASMVALLFIDLDKFKPVNDSFGHAVGDQLLCDITSRMNSMLDNNAVVGRQSGDEFLLLIKNLDSPQSLSNLVHSLTAELAKRVVVNDFAINISASVGVALYPFDADTTDELIRNADIAMMHAKQSGRNGFKFFTEQMNNQITQKLLLENALKDAYKDDLFFNNYQPIVNNKSKKINGVELLMRWQHQAELISPAVFIPIAEETGLIDVLTEQALTRALEELAQLFKANPRFYLSLNLSPMHILKSNLTERLLLILNQHHIKPVQLRLEITENTFLDDKNKAAKQLQALRNAGFKLLLDDFGTGYSSLTYLSQFPIDVIKIDQSFVRNIGQDSNNESIIKTIHTLAENLNLYCIAEGVETIEQIHFLNHIGCADLQGYYFAKPTTADILISDAYIQALQEKLQTT
ncbi:EAL domain-containing protein [Pseudoalteromonas arctica]|uniref:EAL domain-containing protein n=1 Tax=Pseudoalteromonas arctica TaxID=394751 RepID=A0A7Y0DR23_9GAMM|nr:EAL domain-containing protein [Pseudoalteromonas arctica]